MKESVKTFSPGGVKNIGAMRFGLLPLWETLKLFFEISDQPLK